ncbi:hypothetical protein DEO72_LG5g2392 [Vigna unguiculata]|uniref:Uncharacterized protein n=1 Tax=Vigna unguiculata TaxID=3917 RepID=A0A4D6LZB1_VIGUN|nr:hypothetical protein DEO72_LG5g2392 [Vigna unguiculata]
MSQDYQTRQSTTEEGNLTGPILTGHNQHTHTGNTCQPELNSRVPRDHPPSRAQLEDAIPSSTRGMYVLNPYLELNSRDTVHQLGLTAAKSPSGGHIPLGATASRPPGGGHVPPGAERLVNHKFWNYCPVGPYIPPGGRCIQQSMALPLPPDETSSPLGATNSSTPLFHCYRLAASPPPSGVVSVQ